MEDGGILINLHQLSWQVSDDFMQFSSCIIAGEHHLNLDNILVQLLGWVLGKCLNCFDAVWGWILLINALKILYL